MRVLQVENGSFTPIVFSINGGMGRISVIRKRYKPYSLTMSWIRRKLSFSLMRLIITCIRGSRTFKSNIEKQCTSEVASYSEIRCVIQEKILNNCYTLTVIYKTFLMFIISNIIYVIYVQL